MIKYDYLTQEEQVFNDQKQLERFLDYMFRTDITQKWTNDNSRFNRYAIRQDNNLLFFDKCDKSQRLLLKQTVQSSIANANILLLRKNVIHIYADNKEDWYEDDFDKIFNTAIRKELPQILNHPPLYAKNNVAFAMHNDQAGLNDGGLFYMHIHRLYFIDP